MRGRTGKLRRRDTSGVSARQAIQHARLMFLAGQIDHDLGQIYQIPGRSDRYDLDHLDPTLPLGDDAQDLYSTDATEETCP